MEPKSTDRRSNITPFIHVQYNVVRILLSHIVHINDLQMAINKWRLSRVHCICKMHCVKCTLEKQCTANHVIIHVQKRKIRWQYKFLKRKDVRIRHNTDVIRQRQTNGANSGDEYYRPNCQLIMIDERASIFDLQLIGVAYYPHRHSFTELFCDPNISDILQYIAIF